MLFKIICTLSLLILLNILSVLGALNNLLYTVYQNKLFQQKIECIEPEHIP